MRYSPFLTQLLERGDPDQVAIVGNRRGAGWEMTMAVKFAVGDCVEVPDGRIGRVRERIAGGWRVRVRRITSASNQFLVLPANQLRHVPTPKGWMSPAGYRSYLKTTLSKLRARLRSR